MTEPKTVLEIIETSPDHDCKKEYICSMCEGMAKFSSFLSDNQMKCSECMGTGKVNRLCVQCQDMISKKVYR